MTEQQRYDRNKAMLAQCDPMFGKAVSLVIWEAQALGFYPRIQCAWRSVADQMTAFQAGMSHVQFGFHNITGVGGLPEALAVDVLDDDHPLSPSRAYVVALARIGRKHGLQTGIDWDLPMNVRVALNAAIDHGESWPGKIGFDPTHLETTAVTLDQARAGQRPGRVVPLSV